MYTTIVAALQRYLSEIRNGGKNHDALRNQLVVAADNSYLNFVVADFKINTNAGKAALVKVATDFCSTKMIVNSTLLDRGWTETLIKKHIGDPDTYSRNPHYRSGADMKLYSLSKIQCLESKPEIRTAIDKVLKKRTDAAEKRQKAEAAIEVAKEQARAESIAWAYSVNVNVPDIDLQATLSLKRLQSCIWRSPHDLLNALIDYVRFTHTDITADLNKILGDMNSSKEACNAINQRFSEAFKVKYPNALAEIGVAQATFTQVQDELAEKKRLAVLANTPEAFREAVSLADGLFRLLPIPNLVSGDIRMHPVNATVAKMADDLSFPLATFGKYRYQFQSGDNLVLFLEEIHAAMSNTEICEAA